MSTHHIVIVGGGFAGVLAALGAAAELERHDAGDRVRVTLVSPEDALVIKPRLYEADLAGLRVPLDDVLAPVGVARRQAEVETIDGDARRLTLAGPSPGELAFDQLVLCAGAVLEVPAPLRAAHRVDGWAQARAFQAGVAALAADGTLPRRAIVVGAGFTGLELVCELAGTLRAAARRHATPAPELLLLERSPTLGPRYGARGRAVIAAALDALGIEARTGVSVAAADAGSVTLADGERLASGLTVLSTGPRAHPLAAQIPGERDGLGRVIVDPCLQTGAAGVWAAGDLACASLDGSHTSLMCCQHAGPQGRQAGENAARVALGRAPAAYRQPLYLTCLDLGAAGALLTAGLERETVLAAGPAAKPVKRMINRSLIYPPAGDRRALLGLGRRHTPGRLGAAATRAALRSPRLRALAAARAEDRAARFTAPATSAGEGVASPA